MWSVDDAQIAARCAGAPEESHRLVDGAEHSPWDELPSSLVEPDLTALGIADACTDPDQVYAVFWGGAVVERPVWLLRRWPLRRARTG